jgi:hypothetical protein
MTLGRLRKTKDSVRATPHDRLSIRLLFGVAVAALAAAAGDLLVESLSNCGVFGPGRYTDGSNADIAPITITGLLLLLSFLYVRTRHALQASRGSAGWCGVAAALSTNKVTRLLPALFAVQILLLWAMESLEQRFVLGHGLGGTIWLGGPILISLAVHAAVCVGAAFLARSIVIAVEPQAIRLVSALIALENGSRYHDTAQSCAAPFVLSMRPPALRSIGERGPPALAASISPK